MPWQDALAGVSASDVMRPCSVFIGTHDLVTRARAIMRSTGLRTLPVIDGGKLEGIITPREIMQITSTRSNIPVAGLMFPSRLVATPSTELVELARQMVDQEISDVPVVQSHSDRTVVGLVRLDDILKRIAGKVPPRILVGDVMTKGVVTCLEDDEIPSIWDIMEKNRYSGLPVVRYDKVKRANKVIGVITRSDILRSGATRLSEEAAKGRFKAPPRVRSLMRTPAIVVSPQTPVAEAIELMIKRNIGRLPVVDKDNLVGIISRSDIIKLACG
ncbi:MAG: CBS domain-containing protein [Candidatus Hodarchaeaceae archaeon]|nr:CBS domain-containing protein [Candidatus Hodarchaeaceae archaeon]